MFVIEFHEFSPKGLYGFLAYKYETREVVHYGKSVHLLCWLTLPLSFSRFVIYVLYMCVDLHLQKHWPTYCIVRLS